MNEYILNRADGLEGWFHEDEGRRLAALASGVFAHDEVVEIGAFGGRSTAYLAAGVASGYNAHITSLDDWSPAALPDGTDQGAANEVLDYFLANVDWERVTPIRARSTEVFPFWLKPIGLLFLDATHLYEDTARDISEWGTHVYPGAYMAFHDYHEDHLGVIQATDEAVASGAWEHIDLTVSLRVLRKR